MTSILKRIKRNHLFSRLLCLVVGSFVLTFIYNKFLVENDIVVGGISILAILIQQVFNISTTLFINISNVILVILSFITLGKKRTFEQLAGCILYLIMLNITAPLAKMVTFTFTSDMLMLIVVSLIYGLCCGIIYKPGFSTGGSDFLAAILSDKFKVPLTKASLIFQILVILASAFIFDITKVLYSLFVIYLSNKITNAVLFGVSTSKMVYVISDKNEDIKNYIMRRINTGATEIRVQGGYFREKKQMLLCVVHNAHYEQFKNTIKNKDPKAFIVSNNCYEVSGGKKLNILPF